MAYFDNNLAGINTNTKLSEVYSATDITLQTMSSKLVLDQYTTSYNLAMGILDIKTAENADLSAWPVVVIKPQGKIRLEFVSDWAASSGSISYQIVATTTSLNSLLKNTFTDQYGYKFSYFTSPSLIGAYSVKHQGYINSKGKTTLIIENISNINVSISNMEIGGLKKTLYYPSGTFVSDIYHCGLSNGFKAWWKETTPDDATIQMQLTRLDANETVLDTTTIENGVSYSFENSFSAFRYSITLTTTGDTPTFELVGIVTTNILSFDKIGNHVVGEDIKTQYVNELHSNMAILDKKYPLYAMQGVQSDVNWGEIISAKEYNNLARRLNTMRQAEALDPDLNLLLEHNKVVQINDIVNINSRLAETLPVFSGSFSVSPILNRDNPTFKNMAAQNNNVSIIDCVSPLLKGYVKKVPAVYGDGVIGRIAFSPDGEYFAQAYSPQYMGTVVTIYKRTDDTFTWISNYDFSTQGNVWDINWHSNGKIYLVVNSNLIECSVSDGIITEHTAIIANQNIGKSQFSSDGKYLATINGWGGYGWRQRRLVFNLYRLNNGSWENFYTYNGTRNGYPTGLTFAPDSKWIYVGVSKDALYAFKINEDESVTSLVSTPIAGVGTSYISFSGLVDDNRVYMMCGPYLCAGRWDSITGNLTISVFDTLYLDDGKTLNTWADLLAFGSEMEMKASPDGKFVTVAIRDDTLGNQARIYKVEGDNITRVSWKAKGGYATSIAFTPDSKHMVYGTKSGGSYAVRIMDTHTNLEDLCVSVSNNKYLIQWSPQTYPPQLNYTLTDSITKIGHEVYLSKDNQATWQLFDVITDSHHQTDLNLEEYYDASAHIKIIAYDRVGNTVTLTEQLNKNKATVTSYNLYYKNTNGVWTKTNDVVSGNSITTSIIPGIIDYKLDGLNNDNKIIMTKTFQTI
jgi:hypothetical protein